MIVLGFLLGTPLVGIFILALIGGWRRAGELNVLFSLISFVAAVTLAIQLYHHNVFLSPDKLFYIDALNIYLIVLTAFVGMTTAIFSRPYMQHDVETGRLPPQRLRLYYGFCGRTDKSAEKILQASYAKALWRFASNSAITSSKSIVSTALLK